MLPMIWNKKFRHLSQLLWDSIFVSSLEVKVTGTVSKLNLKIPYDQLAKIENDIAKSREILITTMGSL